MDYIFPYKQSFIFSQSPSANPTVAPPFSLAFDTIYDHVDALTPLVDPNSSLYSES